MMTSSNGSIFRVTGPLCEEFTGPCEFPTQRPVTRSFDVFFDLRLKKRLSKQPWGWWFEMRSWSLWRQCNGVQISQSIWFNTPWGFCLEIITNSVSKQYHRVMNASFKYAVCFNCLIWRIKHIPFPLCSHIASTINSSVYHCRFRFYKNAAYLSSSRVITWATETLIVSTAFLIIECNFIFHKT